MSKELEDAIDSAKNEADHLEALGKVLAKRTAEGVIAAGSIWYNISLMVRSLARLEMKTAEVQRIRERTADF